MSDECSVNIAADSKIVIVHLGAVPIAKVIRLEEELPREYVPTSPHCSKDWLETLAGHIFIHLGPGLTNAPLVTKDKVTISFSVHPGKARLVKSYIETFLSLPRFGISVKKPELTRGG